MSKRLILAGGGHAHMMLLANLKNITESDHRVTVVQPSEHHYYSGMGPGMLSTLYSPDEIRFNTRFVVERQGGEFIKAKVTAIDGAARKIHIDSGETLSYDVLSCNVGSFVPFSNINGKSDNVFSAKPIERLLEAQRRILARCAGNSITIGIIGGGPAAIELAGNAYHLASSTGCAEITIRLFAGKKMMAGYSRAIRKIVRKTFTERGIIIDESGYVEMIDDETIVLEDGSRYPADIIFPATGVKPSTIFSQSGLTTGPDGGLEVNDFLQSTDYDNIFGGGDCIHYASAPLDKVGVYAVRENPILLHNVLAALNGTEMKSFKPGGNYLLIFNLGKRIGALQKGPFAWGGKSAFMIKDYIDRKFMRTFQALEE